MYVQGCTLYTVGKEAIVSRTIITRQQLLRMEGDEVLVKVREAIKELDLFNLAVAQWRAANGVSQWMWDLYSQMGQLNIALEQAARLADLRGHLKRLGPVPSSGDEKKGL